MQMRVDGGEGANAIGIIAIPFSTAGLPDGGFEFAIGLDRPR
jgi:hypothetical protein